MKSVILWDITQISVRSIQHPHNLLSSVVSIAWLGGLGAPALCSMRVGSAMQLLSGEACGRVQHLTYVL